MSSEEAKHCPSITEVSKNEKIVDYTFERNEKSNVLAIHPSRPLIAYLINIQRSQKISKAWSSGNDSLLQSPSSSLINGQSGATGLSTDKSKAVSIRIIDYVTRQRCLAKGIYHARPADCVFTINSPTCTQQDVIKMAVVDRLANVYLYELSYYINDLTATRIAVIRCPSHEVSPYESISLVWCPFVPCEDFDDGDGGLRLALALDSKIEIFAVDRLQGRTGELQRNDLGGAYKSIRDPNESTIVSLSISPDCSTISAAASDNRITFYSSDIDDGSSRCLHKWDANMADGIISKLFFLDDYPRLLEDSALKFWGAAFIGTRNGQILLVDLRNWTVYQRLNLQTGNTAGQKNFDYRIDLTAKSVIAISGSQCYIVQIHHDIPSGLPRVDKTTRLSLHTPVYSFVVKNKSKDEIELFTISAYSLELYIINLNILEIKVKKAETSLEAQSVARTIGHREQLKMRHSSTSGSVNVKQVADAACGPPLNDPIGTRSANVEANLRTAREGGADHERSANGKLVVDVNQMDRMVEALFTRLNLSFSQGLDEFLSEVRCEVNDLKAKLNELSLDLNRLHQQMQNLRLN